MANDPVDVLIVGAGASGAAFAWSLAETRMNILCLDQGGWMKPSDYPSNHLDYEVRGFREFSSDPNVRKLPVDYPINAAESPIAPLMFNAVGGSTILWAAHFPRLEPDDFRVRTSDGVADDWPIDFDTLAPFFDVNDRMMGVSGLSGNPASPPRCPPMPPLPLGKVGNVLARGFEQLGWHWWPSDAAIASQEYEGRAPCINLSPCTTGCAQGAKASTDITYWPLAQRRGVRIRTGCRVREVTLRPDGMADGVLYYDADGNLQQQKAEIVVLACNGVGTPRLLLNSVSSQHPNGLSNRSDQVGRNLMFHPVGVTLGIFEEELGHHGPVGCCLHSHEFYDSDPSRGFVRGYSFEAMRGLGPVMAAVMGMQRGHVGWGKRHHERYRRLYNHVAALLTITEDLPDPDNRVTLDPDLKDGSGIPAPKVTYSLSENTRKILAHGKDRATEVLRAAGATEVSAQELMPSAGWHLLGTARMGTDPETSVVNEWGRSHDVKNLFVIDGSVFVTAGAVNPTATIQAVALYIADAIKQRIDTLFD
ncbi:MAG: GMC family oxidoreductase [Myxococcales bacterium]|nr:GMC family oxidoreductase [Myxococcales bacterium]MDD9971987.1 GMC family oxidoreductase [Myxococcales bacterium]